MEWLRIAGPVALAVLAGFACDQLTAERGFLPPGFRVPWRRLVGMFLVTVTLYLAVFAPLSQLGRPMEVDFSRVPPGQLFTLHLLFALALAAWLVTAFGGVRGVGVGRWLALMAGQVGLKSRRPLRELALGGALGLLAWPVVLATTAATAGFAYLLGMGELVPVTPPPMVVWIAGLPLAVRASVSLSAGVMEELFFRGFLQPRIGIPLSTLLFVLAHVSYEEPFMLVGITLLSLLFAGLVRWRRTVWPAVAAHAVFDGLQLLFLVPWVLERWRDLGPAGGSPLGLSG